MEEKSEALEKLFYKYTHLPIGGKEIVCPYWMNNLEKGIYGPIGGKGTPEQIVQVTVDQARAEGVDLTKLDEQGITLFMKAKMIGVDCSGFAFWMLNELDLEKGGDGVADNIPGSQGKIVKARASVAMLCKDEVSFVIEKVSDVKVGDMIRLRRGKHVSIIAKVSGEDDKITEIEYAHSSCRTQVKGVHIGKIKVVDEQLGLENQNWEELTEEGTSYGKEYRPETGDSIRRLNIWREPTFLQ